MIETIDPKRNIVKLTPKLVARTKMEIERYYDKRYHMKRGKKNGTYIWKWIMWRRARQIEYFKRKRMLEKLAR